MGSCRATKDDGSPCGSTSGINPENGLCFWHDPTRRERAQEARRRGGRAAGHQNRKERRYAADVPGPLETPADACRWTAWATQALATGRIDDKTAGKIASLVRAWLSANEKRAQAEEIAELRDEIAALRGPRS